MSAPGIHRREAVRGTARRVVIVPQPEGGAFEQAIFIVRGECAVSEAELMREALAAAGAESSPPLQKPGWRWRLRRKWPWILCGIATVAAALTAFWLL